MNTLKEPYFRMSLTPFYDAVGKKYTYNKV
jgi:hypothetical protein